MRLGSRGRENGTDIPKVNEQRVSRFTATHSNARIVSYDQLIDNALQAYQDFVDREQEAGRVYRLIQGISEQDVEAISPTADQV